MPHFVLRAMRGILNNVRAFISNATLARSLFHHTHMSSDMYRDSIFWVEIERIKPNPFQPRREFDEAKLRELADSIRMYGLLQPLTVTRNEIPRDDGGLSVEYELIAGERRLRASKLAGLLQVPVIIRVGEETDQMKLELAIIENLQREDLNPVDRAKAFDRLAKEFKFTHQEIGRKMGKSREYVSNTLRLLMLPEHILQHLAEGKMSEGHTRPLLMLNDRPEEQQVLAREILLKKLTVRETEALARRAAQDKVTARHKINPEILELERALTEKLGTRVTIEPREVGGRVVISFFSTDDLQLLLDTMRMEQDAEPVFNNMPEMIQPVVNPLREATRIQDEAEAAVFEVPVSDDAPLVAEEARISEEGEEIVDTNTDVGVVDDLPLHEVEAVEMPLEAIRMPELEALEPATVVIVETPTEASPVQQEDDEDLYSIRNFTI